MAKEIERKFLIDPDKIGKLTAGSPIEQAYIATKDKTAVRVRITGNRALLTLKGENQGLTRSEFEYEIPIKDAREMMAELCTGPTIEKTRYLIRHASHTWEVDVFHGDNAGLIVAEIELTSETEYFELPAWVTTEVSNDAKYYNSNLLDKPFKNWA